MAHVPGDKQVRKRQDYRHSVVQHFPCLQLLPSSSMLFYEFSLQIFENRVMWVLNICH